MKFSLTIFGSILSIFLIAMILLRVPQKDVGLASFANKTDLLGSPSSAERSLNIVTITGIFFYLAIAFKLNLLYIYSYMIS